jgi:sugar O-acyltransferase (sialic acid O-acetyltransferase NeuD family)
MKNLIIVGAGGFGRSIYNLATECLGFNTDFQIKGFLDDDLAVLDSFANYPPILATINEYIIQQDDVFTCSIGSVPTKKKVIQQLISRGARFITLIHNTANVAKNAQIGTGSIIAINSILDSDSIVKDFVLIQSGSVIGHDASVGNFSRIDCNVVCVGGVIIEDEVTLHTSAIINHKVVVGKQAVVGAGSFVIRRVKENTVVHGNPATRLK